MTVPEFTFSKRMLVAGSNRTGRGFPQCHAPSLGRLPDGRLVAAYFAGTREKYPDTAIWASCQSEGGSGSWTEPQVVVKLCQTAHWNPVLFNDADGRLWLFFKVGETVEGWEAWRCQMDGGLRPLRPPVRLSKLFGKGGRGPVRSAPIVLSNGEWLAPASTERTVSHSFVERGGFQYRVPDVIWDAFTDRTSNCGTSWRKSKKVPIDRKKWGELGGLIQPTLWESSPGNVHMLLRSTHGFLFRSDSSDFGRTWSQAEVTEIPNPNSAVDVAKLADGTLVLGYNPVSGNWVPRDPLAVAYSSGEGRKWSQPVTVEQTKPETVTLGRGSYSYPSILPTPEGYAIAYSWNRVNIGFVQASMSAASAKVVEGESASVRELKS